LGEVRPGNEMGLFIEQPQTGMGLRNWQ